MNVTPFFNRPDKPIDLQQLWADMSNTSDHLVLASAWFTDTETAEKFIQSPAGRKTIVLNAADLNRGDKRAVAILRAYDREWGKKYTYAEENSTTNTDVNFCVLGSGNWQEGVMHHKFILCDRVVWLGSFNFTFQARKNYETLVRIEDEATARLFYNEVNDLDPYGERDHSKPTRDPTFQCSECDRIMSWNLLGEDLNYGTYICRGCLGRIDR